MAKRFLDNEMYRKPWFRRLSPTMKCLWLYLLCNCDHAGVWAIDWDDASWHIGEKIEPAKALPEMAKQVEILPGGDRLWLTGFIEYQYPKGLSKDNRAHNPVFASIDHHKLLVSPIDGPSKGLSDAPKGLTESPKGLKDNSKDLAGSHDGSQDKDMDKDMDKDLDKDRDKDAYPEEITSAHHLNPQANRILKSYPQDRLGPVRAAVKECSIALLDLYRSGFPNNPEGLKFVNITAAEQAMTAMTGLFEMATKSITGDARQFIPLAKTWYRDGGYLQDPSEWNPGAVRVESVAQAVEDGQANRDAERAEQEATAKSDKNKLEAITEKLGGIEGKEYLRIAKSVRTRSKSKLPFSDISRAMRVMVAQRYQQEEGK
jgi:hypothetical protein